MPGSVQSGLWAEGIPQDKLETALKEPAWKGRRMNAAQSRLLRCARSQGIVPVGKHTPSAVRSFESARRPRDGFPFCCAGRDLRFRGIPRRHLQPVVLWPPFMATPIPIWYNSLSQLRWDFKCFQGKRRFEPEHCWRRSGTPQQARVYAVDLFQLQKRACRKVVRCDDVPAGAVQIVAVGAVGFPDQMGAVGFGGGVLGVLGGEQPNRQPIGHAAKAFTCGAGDSGAHGGAFAF